MSNKTEKPEAKYYILSNLHKHGSAVIEETETTVTIQKVIAVERDNDFSGSKETVIVPDPTHLPRTESKNDLSKVLDDVELTKDYWRVYEFLTGIKRKAVAQNSES